MSKAVKKVFRAVKKVVSGAVKTVGKIVKGVIKSPIFKAVAFAAAVYFGVPAVMGAFGAGGAAAAGGLSGFAGAAANVSAAWSGLSGAATSVMSAEFSKAGSQLASGFGGNVFGAGSALPATAAPVTAGAVAPITDASIAASAGGSVLPEAAGTAGKGWFASLSPNAATAVTTGGFQAASTLGQGIMANSQAKAAEEEKRRQEKNYNTNIGTNLFLRSGGKPAYQPTDFSSRFGG